MDPSMSAEETLDPQDWGAMRSLGRRMVDDMLTWLETVRERKVWQPVPAEVKAHLQQPLPREGEPPEAIYEDFRANILPYPMGNVHRVSGAGSWETARRWGCSPRCWPPASTRIWAAPNMWASTSSGRCSTGRSRCSAFPKRERPVGERRLDGNLVGLAVARNVHAGFDVRREGLQAGRQRLIFYTSSEAHSSIQKAVELLGLGSDSLRLLPVDRRSALMWRL